MADFYQRVGTEFYVRDRSAQGVRGFLGNITRVRREMTSIQRTLTTAFGLGFGYLGLRGLVQGLKSVTAAAMEQEKAERQLQAAVGWSNEQRATATDEAKRYAAAMQRATVYGDEEILSQMAYGRQLGITTDKLDEATTAAVGLAAKYRLDLSSAMMLVGRASQGQTQMLTRYGIVLSETMTDEEKFEELLRLGGEAFSLAREEAQTSAGQLAQYRNIMGDVRETLGNALLPAYRQTMMGIAGYLQNNLDDIRDWAEGTVSLFQWTAQQIEKVFKFEKKLAETLVTPGIIEAQARERYLIEYPEDRGLLEARAKSDAARRSGAWYIAPQTVGRSLTNEARLSEIRAQLTRETIEVDADREQLRAERQQLRGQYPEVTIPDINLPGGAADLGKQRVFEQEATDKATESVQRHFEALQKEQDIIGRMDESRWRAGDYVQMRQAVTQLSDAQAEALLREIRLRKDLNALTPSQTDLMDEYEAQMDRLRVSEMVNDSMEDLASTLTEIAFDFENAEQYATRFFESLARNTMTELITQPGVDAFKKAGYDLFRTLFTPGTTTGTGGTTGAATVNPSSGYVDPGTGYSTVTGYRLGGRVGYGGGTLYRVPTAAFATAPRMKSGGRIDANAVPIVAHRDETIVPAGARFTMPSPTINIHNETGTAIDRTDVGMEVDPHEMIVNVWLRDVNTGGPSRDVVRR